MASAFTASGRPMQEVLALASASGSADVSADGSANALAQALTQATQPVVLRGLVAQWPLVQMGLQSPQALCTYLRSFYRDVTVDAWLGDPGIQGRFFYNGDFTGFNFRPQRLRLDEVLA